MDEERPDFTGTWKVTERENFDAFLQATGAPWLVSKAVSAMRSTVDIKQNGDDFHIHSSYLFMSRDEYFTIGQEYEQAQPMGATSKGLATWDGNKLCVTYQPHTSGVQGQTVVRQLLDKHRLLTTLTTGDVVSKCFYERVP